MLQCSPLDLNGSQAFFLPWDPGFDATKAIEKGGNFFPITVAFPNLRQQYIPMLSAIAAKIGMVLSDPRKEMGMPAKRIMVSSVARLPAKVLLPKQHGSLLEQRVEYV